jgi:hypothetical protein
MKTSNPPIELTQPPLGMSLWLDPDVVRIKKSFAELWPDKSGNGRSPLSPHYHPMQRIQRTWWPD